MYTPIVIPATLFAVAMVTGHVYVGEDSLPGVTIRIESTDGTHETVSGSAGEFTFPNIASGPALLRAEVPGLTSQRYEVCLKPTNNWQIYLHVQGGSCDLTDMTTPEDRLLHRHRFGYNGTAVDASGGAIAGVAVEVLSAGTSSRNGEKTMIVLGGVVTDRNGAFSLLLDLPEDTYPHQLRLSARDFSTVILRVPCGSEVGRVTMFDACPRQNRTSK